MTDTERLEQIKNRMAKASPGPWTKSFDSEFVLNAAFDIPFLLELVARLQEELAESIRAEESERAIASAHIQRGDRLEAIVKVVEQYYRVRLMPTIAGGM